MLVLFNVVWLFMLWVLQLNMHRVWYKCQTIHESGNSGDFWEKYKHHIHELENFGESHDKQKQEIQDRGNLGEFMKNKNKFALWAAAAALHIWRFATKSTTLPKNIQKKRPFCKEVLKILIPRQSFEGRAELARTRCLENGESFNGCQSRVTASDPESFLNLSSKWQSSSSIDLEYCAAYSN